MTDKDETITELGKIIECKNGTIATLANIRDRLKADNERLQKLTCFNCGEETLNPSGAEIYDKILVYKQTLQEIREIAEEWINNDWSCFHCRSNMDEKLKEIIDLITKAEEE